ncbi:MAG: methylmalonyl-CoA mutase family protein [Filomicrobium sp.]
MTADTLKLTSGFDTVSEEAWRALVDKALKGGDFEKRLVSKTADGLRIDPLYDRQADAGKISRADAGHPWRLSARVDHPDRKVANEFALDDLTNGADSLTLVFPGSLSARGYGLDCETVADLDAVLADVGLDMITLRLDPAPAARVNAALVAALVDKRGLDPNVCKVDFGIDPIGNLASRGVMAGDWTTIAGRAADAASTLKAKGFAGPFLSCDIRPYHEAGASEVQELAIALSTGVAYLRALVDRGFSGEDAARALSFTVAVDADQFAGLAKLRAFRRLWARVEDASGITSAPMRINVESAWRMMSRVDPWVNMLRGTMATFTAGIGGADSMTVLPHTMALGLPDGFARRIARNTQSVLLEESSLFKVADPAAGAGGYEALTDEISAAAWSLFQDIEGNGGIVECLKSGSIQKDVSEMAAARAKDVARRKVQITGTSEFPLLGEGALEVLDVAANPDRGTPKGGEAADTAFGDVVAALTAGKSRSDVLPGPGATQQAEPLQSHRIGEPFEALRDKAERYKAAHGSYPQIFLASLGPIAAHTARSTWIKNLLAAGGIEALTSDGFAGPEEAVSAFQKSEAKIACICSSDELYGEMAANAATALKDQGAKRVLLAGRPGDLEAALTAAGVDQFVFAGQDMIDLLTGLQEQLGVG